MGLVLGFAMLVCVFLILIGGPVAVVIDAFAAGKSEDEIAAIICLTLMVSAFNWLLIWHIFLGPLIKHMKDHPHE